MTGEFGETTASFGTSGKHQQNLERDFLRDARLRLGVHFEVYPVTNIVRDALHVTKDQDIGILLPHEVAHWLWAFNPEKLNELFPRERVVKFWKRAIEDKEPWFVRHPLCDEICHTAESGGDLYNFWPIQLFGDDGTLKKSRAMGSITWFPAVFSEATTLDSRIPVYVVPRHILVKDYTENRLQEALCWSFEMWATGRFPHVNHLQRDWPSNSLRALFSSRGHKIAGGHIGVYVGSVCDQLWGAQHFRWSSIWSTVECCSRCFARNEPGPLNFTNPGPFPERSRDD